MTLLPFVTYFISFSSLFPSYFTILNFSFFSFSLLLLSLTFSIPSFIHLLFYHFLLRFYLSILLSNLLSVFLFHITTPNVSVVLSSSVFILLFSSPFSLHCSLFSRVAPTPNPTEESTSSFYIFLSLSTQRQDAFCLSPVQITNKVQKDTNVTTFSFCKPISCPLLLQSSIYLISIFLISTPTLWNIHFAYVSPSAINLQLFKRSIRLM